MSLEKEKIVSIVGQEQALKVFDKGEEGELGELEQGDMSNASDIDDLDSSVGDEDIPEIESGSEEGDPDEEKEEAKEEEEEIVSLGAKKEGSKEGVPSLSSILHLGEQSTPQVIVSEDESTDEENDEYLQKLDHNIEKNFILELHPEKKIHNYEEVKKFSIVHRDKQGNIVDPLHKTTPILTKYERAKVLGQRAKQLDEGATPFVEVPSKILEGYLIAEEELKQKKIPFVIRRPIPNGGVEYWPIKYLQVID
jgi:DNA-directed RNA polymerase I, II, and III subunit RPABC2